MPAVVMIQLFVPGQIQNPLNGSLSRAHWTTKRRWSATWARDTQLMWLRAGTPRLDGPSEVTFTAYVARRFDDDGLTAAIKPIRDAGVRCVLGTDDGPRCGHVFIYRQEMRPKSERGVLIQIESLLPGARPTEGA